MPIWRDCPLDGDGKRHGRSQVWTQAGVLINKCPFVRGEAHGKSVTFHPDGNIASEVIWVTGTQRDGVHFRSEVETPHSFAPDVADNVWSAQFLSRDGIVNYTQRYFDREQRAVSSEGGLLPPRPPALSEDARYMSDSEQWVLGDIRRKDGVQVGAWKWWDKLGTLVQEEERNDAGEPIRIVRYVDGEIASRERYESFAGERVFTEHERRGHDGQLHWGPPGRARRRW
jgi:hypothetical protein